MKSLLRIVALAAGLVAGSAFGHAELSQSMPADKAALATAPKEVMLHFSEAVRLTALSLKKKDGAAADLKPLPTGTSQAFAVPAGELTTGEYTVEWRALSDDGHALRGDFSFTVGVAAAPGQSAPASPHAEHAAGHAEHSDHPQH